MRKIIRHNCSQGSETVGSDYLEVFYDTSDDTWYLKIEEPEYDVFESYAVSIQYCPLCGAVLAPNNKEVLEAKQRYHEAKLSEINHHLESLNTTKRPNACVEIPIVEYRLLKEEYERAKKGVIFNSDFVSEK